MLKHLTLAITVVAPVIKNLRAEDMPANAPSMSIAHPPCLALHLQVALAEPDLVKVLHLKSCMLKARDKVVRSLINVTVL